MRYLIETEDQEGLIGIQISKWEKENKLRILTKGDPVEIIKADLVKIKQAFETLKKLGINQDVMETYIRSKSGCTISEMKEILYYQEEFFKKLGVK